MAQARPFLRKASGLVREVSTFDVLVYNVFLCNVGFMLFMVLYWVLYPGADMTIAVVITTILCVIQGLTYGLLCAAYPRSGGEYVFITRILHPALGFDMSWSFWAWNVFYVGLTAGLAASQAIVPLLSGAGFVTNNSALLSAGAWAGTPNVSFIIGVVTLVVYALLLISGTKNYFSVQKVFFVIAMASVFVVVALLATTTHPAFVARFNNFARPFSNSTDTYTSIINVAKTQGYQATPFSLLQSVLFVVWPFFAIGFTTQSASFSGEVKDVRRSQLVGMVGAVLVMGIVWSVLIILSLNIIGYDFLQSTSYLMLNSPSSIPIPVTPWYSLLTALTSDNLALSVFILFGWFCWFLLLVAVGFLYNSRVSFAWAMDGLLPDAFSKVSERFRTPINSIMLCGVLSAIFLAIYTFTSWLSVLSGLLGFAPVWIFTSLAAVVFPFRRRDYYKKSGINREVAGIPIISVFGAMNAVIAFALMYMIATDSRFGANGTISIATAIGFFVVGLIVFYAMRAIRKRQGVDLDALFKEIPVE